MATHRGFIMGSIPVIRLAVTGGVYLIPSEKRIYAPPTWMIPSASTAAMTGSEKSLSAVHSGEKSMPAVS